MNYVPRSLVRFGYRQGLKIQKQSPTLLVVTGVVGLGVTAVMAAHATRKLDPILEGHHKQRFELEQDVAQGLVSTRTEQRQLVRVYSHTGLDLAKLYGPTIAVGTLSAASVLYGHKVLNGRHLATMAAYSGLMEQFQAYRARVAETVGSEMERDIHQGAVGKYEEDPNHKGEYKLKSKFGTAPGDHYLRPFFDEANANWTRNPSNNEMFLRAAQNHWNRVLDIRGHVFLVEVYDGLGIPRVPEAQVTGWLRDSERGDQYIDFGFMTSEDPRTIAFRNGAEPTVRLDFNVDGVIWDLI